MADNELHEHDWRGVIECAGCDATLTPDNEGNLVLTLVGDDSVCRCSVTERGFDTNDCEVHN